MLAWAPKPVSSHVRAARRKGLVNTRAKHLPRSCSPSFVGVALAAVGQRQIGQSGVLARETPRGLTVPCEVNDGKCFIHDFVSLQRAQLRLAVTVDRQGQR
jgi:hypothetical protein